MGQAEHAIAIEGVAKSFQGREVLRDVTLRVRRGETVVLFGPSGVGKTLLLKICLGLVQPDLGRVLLEGQDITSMNERDRDQLRRSCGMLFQYYALFDSMTVAENIGFFLKEQLHQDRREIHRRVEELLSIIDLPGIGHLKPAELSGGMQRRVGIARALAHQPRLLFYDSPTDGLDPITADRINDLIVNLGRHHDTSAVAISNDMATAYKIGSRVGMLYDGTILEVASPEEIQATGNPYVRQFIEGLEDGPIQFM